MADGHLNKCKSCARADAKRDRDENPEKHKARDAARYQNDPRVRQRHKAYAISEKGQASAQKSRLKYIENNPEKHSAHTILNNAVRDGKINKPDTCSICGCSEKLIHGHHDDYSKPLDVIWCCPDCHANIHRKINEEHHAPDQIKTKPG